MSKRLAMVENVVCQRVILTSDKGKMCGLIVRGRTSARFRASERVTWQEHAHVR